MLRKVDYYEGEGGEFDINEKVCLLFRAYNDDGGRGAEGAMASDFVVNYAFLKLVRDFLNSL